MAISPTTVTRQKKRSRKILQSFLLLHGWLLTNFLAILKILGGLAPPTLHPSAHPYSSLRVCAAVTTLRISIALK